MKKKNLKINRLPMLITKRNGDVVVFRADKISEVINKVRLETEEFEFEDVELIAGDVLDMIEDYDNVEEIAVDKVHEFVETAFINRGLLLSSRAYISYISSK